MVIKLNTPTSNTVITRFILFMLVILVKRIQYFYWNDNLAIKLLLNVISPKNIL